MGGSVPSVILRLMWKVDYLPLNHIDSDHVYLNDPDLPEAPVAVPLADFDLAWLAQDERYAVLQV